MVRFHSPALTAGCGADAGRFPGPAAFHGARKVELRFVVRRCGRRNVVRRRGEFVEPDHLSEGIQFIQGIITEAVDGNSAFYESTFRDTRSEQASDPHWRAALATFAALPESQRPAFFAVLRQVAVDSVSNVFGIRDGSSTFGTHSEEFRLSTSTGERLTDLQDSFLSHFTP